MVQVQNDPHSHYYSREESVLQQHRLAKERIGIGIEVMKQTNRFVIVDVVPGTTAADHLQGGDEILQVNQQDVGHLEISEFVKLLSGKEGTAVHLKIFRKSSQTVKEIELNRVVIPQTTVVFDTMEHRDERFGYIKLRLFGEGTADEWSSALTALQKQSVSGLVIDLRGNPGGYLGSVVPILSSLTRQGEPLIWLENSKGELEKIITEDEEMIDLPVVLLQDQNSASASEVMLAALLESNRAISIGETSFGKGTVQETFEFGDKSSLKLTTKKWLTPKKNWVHGKGIEPTIQVTLPSPDEILTFPQTEEEWQTIRTALQKLGYTAQHETSDIAPAILRFQQTYQTAPNGLIDQQFLSELHLQYKQWLKQKENDEALRLALDYFQQSD